MAQTKRKRRTKHRGNAAGVVHTRGRTGRRPEPKKPQTREEKRTANREQRMARYDKPPTWKSAITRALIATALFFVVVALVMRQPIGSAAGLAAFMLVVYVPLGFYTDRFFYRRRQRQKAQARAEGGKPPAKVEGGKPPAKADGGRPPAKAQGEKPPAKAEKGKPPATAAKGE